jgi:hypothetical protein
MAIFLTFPDGEPADYNTAFNDNVWVWKTSTNTPTIRFRIAILPPDYPTSPAIGQVRVYPTTANNGNNYQTAFFDPSRFLQSYVKGEVDIKGANHNGFYVSNQMHKEYFLAIQEEDKDASGVYQNGNLFISKVKSVWNGVRNEIEWLDFDYTEYIINNTPSTTKKFLTDSPRTIRIDSDQSYHLYFIANERFGAYQYNIKAYSGYNATGSLLADGIVDNNISVANSWNEIYFRIPVGTHDIGNIDPALYSDTLLGSTPSTALNGAASYTIHLEDNTNAQTSERLTFNVNQTCSKYNEVRVHWLNRLGGYDAFNFYMKSVHTTDIKKDKYDQQHHDWTGFAYIYDKQARGTTDYNVALNKKVTVNTDYLSEAESAWLEDLATSPSVYIEENNELIAVNIDPRRIQRKTSLNDKLMQYTFELNYSIKNRRQRG